MSRVIMHIDFNSYFASCEQQDNLAWRGKPLGVCEHLGGIIIAASVEAKRWGIKTGTPVWEARKLYPKIILTKTRPDRYRFFTARFLKVLADYTEDVEKYSIDEAFLDVTKACNIKKKIPMTNDKYQNKSNNLTSKIYNWEYVDPYREAENIALAIKERLKTEVGDYLRCSVGVGWNKLVAKLGSDMKKPDGLTVLRPTDKEWLYRNLKLTDIPGINTRQESNLNALGILTLADLRDYDFNNLIRHFGIMGYHLHSLGQLEGSFREEFGAEEPLKSMGHVYTIAREHRRPGVAEQVLAKLSEMVAVRLRSQDLQGGVIGAHAYNEAVGYVGATRKLGYLISDGSRIFKEARLILEKEFTKLGLEFGIAPHIKQVGVTIAGLLPFTQQLSIFGEDEKLAQVAKAMDKINRKYEFLVQSKSAPETGSYSIRQTSKLGDAHEGLASGFTVARVPVWQAKRIIRDSVGFGRMKEFRVKKHFNA